ncbi:Beta subunit of farnesyltransferase [Ceraceosorus bombacis]|uniref:Beta subunit of farnesyltransferase n=1 Tax=Ceraceosorus bombacis TaxID=401625 RepID=A0A0P1BS24_9BASI|nr:Beta subunit of farnesyltransferase [Ceraceosorus bombacis]
MSVIYQAAVPAPDDDVPTSTSREQRETEDQISDLSSSSSSASASASASEPAQSAQAGLSLPSLSKSKHLAFLKKGLQPLPAGYVVFDATRPWLIYWASQASLLLSSPFDADMSARATSTLLSCQSPMGGFGGGPGQIPHLMATYAAVLALAIVGGPGHAPDIANAAGPSSSSNGGGGKSGWDSIDRSAMYNMFMSLKQPDGSFTVHHGGEIDVRAAYCVVTVSLLLGIATPELFEGLPSFLGSCQTYEGGLASASHPAYKTSSNGKVIIDPNAPRPTLGEAHAGYAFCALASHLALSLLPLPASELPEPRIDVSALVAWSASLQANAADGGGFRGRTNKLVDGCYGWFSGGGMFTCLQAAVEMEAGEWWKEAETGSIPAQSTGEAMEADDVWQAADDPLFLPADGVLFDRAALQEYILVVAQEALGGLRDKPGKRPDLYHTCYNLSGMSLAQHRLRLDMDGRSELAASFKYATNSPASSDARHTTPWEKKELHEWRRACYASSLSWNADAEKVNVVGDGGRNWLLPTHPIFNIPFPCAKSMMDWSYGQS